MNVLDVGCGDGLAAIKRGLHEHEYVGIDVDPDKVERARERGLEVSHGDVCAGLSFDDNTFDRVIAKAVLEHVADPLEAARECRRVLKPDGWFTVIVPSDRSYDVWGDYTHKRAFRRDSLQDVLTHAGFRVDDIHARMGWSSVGMAMKSLARMAAPWTPYGYPRAWQAEAIPR